MIGQFDQDVDIIKQRLDRRDERKERVANRHRVKLDELERKMDAQSCVTWAFVTVAFIALALWWLL